jgi:catechol 2,3-dioxygenase-like lactoylglutathione lyase family enzyme
MINGGHVMIFSKDAKADRSLFRDVLRFSFVDAHDGWLIFKLPPSEVAIHPSDENGMHEIYLMSDDLDADVAALREAQVECEDAVQLTWARMTRIKLPGGGTLGLYHPRHARP